MNRVVAGTFAHGVAMAVQVSVYFSGVEACSSSELINVSKRQYLLQSASSCGTGSPYRSYFALMQPLT